MCVLLLAQVQYNKKWIKTKKKSSSSLKTVKKISGSSIISRTTKKIIKTKHVCRNKLQDGGVCGTRARRRRLGDGVCLVNMLQRWICVGIYQQDPYLQCKLSSISFSR